MNFSPRCTIAMWDFKLPFSENAMAQESHLKSFFISCTIETCTFRVSFVENDVSQVTHWKPLIF